MDKNNHGHGSAYCSNRERLQARSHQWGIDACLSTVGPRKEETLLQLHLLYIILSIISYSANVSVYVT